MKDSSEYAVHLRRLCNRLQRSGVKITEPESFDVTTELLLGCLSGYMTENKSRTALNKLRNNFVDYNELRVTRTAEVIEILGRGFSPYRPVFDQMLCLLRSIFDEQDHLDLEHLKHLGKREARAFLEELDGTTPYAVSRAMLRGLEGHAFPVHEQMLKMLRAEEVVDPSADAATVQGFLERQITAKRAPKVYALLRRHADNFKEAKAARKLAPQAPPGGKKKKAKRTTKKKRKTARKTAGKKKT